LRIDDPCHASAEDLNALREAPVGVIRINAPRQAIRLVLIPPAAQFLALHPRATLDFVADDAMTDVVAEGFDAGVRFGHRPGYDRRPARPAAPLRRRRRAGLLRAASETCDTARSAFRRAMLDEDEHYEYAIAL